MSDPEEIRNFNKDEYNIESNTYEDLAEDFNVYWVLARASGEVGKAEFESELDDVEKSKKRQSSLKIVQKSKVRITVKKATDKRIITQIILDKHDPSDDSRDQDVENLRQNLDDEEELKSDTEES
ncbi:hypothetical protein BDZ91DRAFT_804003 [Kalaharituber pfeilii]|nr:hypothetical protein BDZ91DRAFT_804003 [Kalaharituber pfeilii]